MKVEFWNKYAPFYNLFMKKDEKMYREMFSLIRRQVMGKTVLEVATGTGLIAKNIADCTKRTDATDYSEKMIQQAKKAGIDPKKDLSIKKIIVAGELGGSIDSTRKAIEDLWGAEVYDFYGLSDIFGA